MGGGKMQSAINKRNWWIVLAVAGVLAIGAFLVQQNLLPEYDFAAFLFVVIVLGIAFYWVYRIDKQELWWSLIPALVMVALLATGIVGYLTPKDASGSSAYGVITLGLSAAIIGFVLKHPAAKFVFYMIAIITLLVGILMLPLAVIWKIVLIIVEAAIIGYLAWQTSRQMRKT
ncbi:MAG TPA: hypothetical protein VF893_05730 [Candidatus Bathyarchaeia archaeon]